MTKEKSLANIFTETGTFGVPKIELDVQGDMAGGSTAQDIAAYLADNSGLNYDLLTEDFDDDDIIRGLATFQGEDFTDPSAFKVFTEAGAKSLMQSVPMFEGAKMGFQIGMKAPGALKLFTPVTTAAGAVSGYYFGDNISELFNFEDNVVPSKMPFKVSGETFGGGMGFTQSAFRAANVVQPGTFAWMKQNAKDLGDKISPTFLEKVGYSAQTSPALTVALETGSVIGSSIGAGISEEGSPGDSFQRLLSEIVGGTTGGPLIANFAPTIITGAKNLFKYFSASGRQSMVAENIAKLIEKEGGDINAILKAIDEAEELGIEGVPTGAVMPEGSKEFQIFKSLNAKLFEDYKYYKKESVAQLRNNLSGAEKLINAMVETKDPNLIADAARIRDELFKTKITLRLADARIKAERIINKMAPGAETAGKASRTIQDLVFKALDDVRAEEKRLYQLIPGGTEITAPATRKTLQNIIGKEILEGELKELGIKPSGLQVINKILGVTTEKPGFGTDFLNASDQNQRGFFRLVGYSPTPLRDVDAPSGKWQVDKAIIADEYNLKRGALNNLSIDDLKKNNFSALDNIFFEDGGDAISQEIRKDLFDALSSKHLKSLRELGQNLSFRGSANDKSLSKLIDNYIKDFTAKQPEQETGSILDEKFLSLKDILNLRSQLFSTARAKSAAGDTRDAGIINKIANSITDDIGTKADAGDGTSVTNLLKQAHSFSKSLNDTFTRGFPNTILKKQKSGKLNVIPELAVNSIFQGGGDAVAYNYSGIESAITFLQKQSGKELDESLTNKLGTLKAAQEDLMNVMFSEVVNQDTKRVDPEKLARFMSYAKGGYGKVLDRFPDLKKDLKNLETAQNLYDARKKYYGEVEQGILKPGNMQALKRLEKIFSFSDFIGKDTNPGLVIANAIGDPNQRPGNPVNNLKRLIAFGRKAQNPDVLEGIKEVIFDRAFQFARNEKDVVDFKAFKDYLVKPMVKGQPSVLEVLRSNGVLDSNEAVRFSTVINRMITSQKSIPDDVTVPIKDSLVSGPNVFFDLFARLIGSKVGSSLSNLIPGRGTGIIESAAGVRFVLGGLQIPTSMTQDIILEMAKDPKFFKLVMTQPRTQKEALVTLKRVRGYLLNSGLGFVSRDEQQQEQKEGAPPLPRQFDPDFIPIKQSSVQSDASVPTTQVTKGPESGLNTRLAANVGAAPQAAPNPNQRQQFASLFPNDPISGLINAQQPTQFMQDGGVAGGPLSGYAEYLSNQIDSTQVQPFIQEIQQMANEKFNLNQGIGSLPTIMPFNPPLQKDLSRPKMEVAEPLLQPTSIFQPPPMQAEMGQPIRDKDGILRPNIDQQIFNDGFRPGTTQLTNSIDEVDPYRVEFDKLVAQAQQQRKDGFMGRVMLPGEMPFEQWKENQIAVANSGPLQGMFDLKLFRDGGAASDMGLETDLAAQKSIQSSLEDRGDDNPTQFSYLPQTIGRGVESLLRNINMTPDTTGIQNFVRDTSIGMTTPFNYQTNIGGFPVTFTPTIQRGGGGILATATFAGGGPVRYMYTGGTAGDEQSMGLESDVAAQQDIQDSLDSSGDTSNIPDLQKEQIQKGFVTNYIKNLLKTNQVRDIQRDKFGRITGVTSVHNPFDPTQLGVSGIMGLLGQAIPGVSTISNVVSGLFGPATTYTGYNPKSTKDPNDNGNDNELVRKKLIPIEDLTPLTSRQIYNQNPNQYTLRTR